MPSPKLTKMKSKTKCPSSDFTYACWREGIFAPICSFFNNMLVALWPLKPPIPLSQPCNSEKIVFFELQTFQNENTKKQSLLRILGAILKKFALTKIRVKIVAGCASCTYDRVIHIQTAFFLSFTAIFCIAGVAVYKKFLHYQLPKNVKPPKSWENSKFGPKLGWSFYLGCVTPVFLLVSSVLLAVNWKFCSHSNEEARSERHLMKTRS